MESGELSTDPVDTGELSSYPVGNLAGMTKRRNPSPYPHPPSEFCRELMSKGWRRCYAEGIDVVRLALAHAHDPQSVRIWAARAAKALTLEPVVVGAIHLLAEDGGVAMSALLLLVAAPKDQQDGLARFTHAAMRAPRLERVLD